MKKKNAQIKLIIISCIALIGIIFSVVSFNMINSYKVYNGFVGAIETSTELQGGNLAILNVKDEEATAQDINTTIKELEEISNKFTSTYSDLSITKQVTDGKTQIRVYFPNGELGTDFYELIGTPVKFEVKLTSSATGDNIITNKDIETVTYSSDGSHYGVYITLTADAKSQLIAHQNDTLYYFIDGETATGNTYSNSIFVYTSSYSSANDASKAAISMLGGKLTTELSFEETYSVSAIAGTNIVNLLLIILGVVCLLIVLYFVIAYRVLGLVELLSLAIFFVLDSFMLQAIPLISMTLGGYFAVLVTVFIVSFSILYTNSKIKDELKLGKKLQSAVNVGLRKSTPVLIDTHVVALIASFSIYMFGNTLIKSAMMVLIAGIAISALTVLLFNKAFIRYYYVINPDNLSKYNLAQGGTDNE